MSSNTSVLLHCITAHPTEAQYSCKIQLQNRITNLIVKLYEILYCSCVNCTLELKHVQEESTKSNTQLKQQIKTHSVKTTKLKSMSNNKPPQTRVKACPRRIHKRKPFSTMSVNNKLRFIPEVAE